MLHFLIHSHSSHILVSGVVVLIYDTILNFDKEIELVWSPLFNAFLNLYKGRRLRAGGYSLSRCLLELAMRYAMIMVACMNILGT